MKGILKPIISVAMATLLVAAALIVSPAAYGKADAAYAIGSLLASDSFESSAGAWEGASGGTGWGESWKTQYADSTIPGYNIAGTTPLTFANLRTQGNYAVGGINYSSVGRLFDLTSGSPFKSYLSGSGLKSIGRNGGTLYVSFLLRKETDTNDAVYGNLHNSEISYSTVNPLVAAGYFGTASDSGGSRYWSLRVGSTVYRTSQPVVAGETALMVLKIQFDSTSKVSLYVNPTTLAGADPIAADQTQTTTANLAFRSFQYYGGKSPGLGSLDEMRVGNSYAAVTPTMVYEAENAALTGPNTLQTSVAGYTGTGYVRTPLNNEAATMTFTVEVPVAGTYFIAIRYNSSASRWYGPRKSLYANGVKVRQVKFQGLAESGGGWIARIEQLPLIAGTNTIAVNNETGDTQTMNIDSLSVLSRLPDNGFAVDGTQIVAPDGSDFLVKGTSSSGPDFANFYENTAAEADWLSRVWNFNSVRIDVNVNQDYSSQNDDLDEIVNEYTRRGVVVMLAVVDNLSGSFPSAPDRPASAPTLTQLTNYWTDKASKYKDNPYVWFNIMNEPGKTNSDVLSYWKTDHEAVIQAIRGAGADNVIVLDENAFGQAGGGSSAAKSGVLTYGTYFTSHYDNIAFSLHVYDGFNGGQSALQQYIDDVQADNLSLHIGEFGVGNNDFPSFSATMGMYNTVIAEGIGRSVWNWSGGDRTNRLVELAATSDGIQIEPGDGITRPTNLTWLGGLVWDDTHNTMQANRTDVALGGVYADHAVFAFNSSLKFMTTIRNAGLTELTASDHIKVNFRVNGTVVSSKTIYGPLKVNDTVSVVSDAWLANPTAFTLSADIDASGSSYGTDAVSANNSQTASVNGIAGTTGADLTITDITSDSAQVGYGMDIQLGAVVKNQGSTAITGRPITVMFGVDGTDMRDSLGRFLTTTQTVTLTPGQSVTISPTYKWLAKIQHDAHVTARIIDGAADVNTANQKRYKTLPYSSALSNFVVDGGLENIDTLHNTFVNWLPWGRLAPVTSPVHSGTHAAYVYNGGPGGSGQLNLPLQPGTTYTIEAWAMNASTPGVANDVGVAWTNADTTSSTTALHFTETSWTHKTATFTTPASFSNAYVFFYKNDAASDFFVDDIAIR